MHSLRFRTGKLFANYNGQAIVEYTLIVLLVAIAFWLGVRDTQIGQGLQVAWNDVGSALSLITGYPSSGLGEGGSGGGRDAGSGTGGSGSGSGTGFSGGDSGGSGASSSGNSGTGSGGGTGIGAPSGSAASGAAGSGSGGAGASATADSSPGGASSAANSDRGSSGSGVANGGLGHGSGNGPERRFGSGSGSDAGSGSGSKSNRHDRLIAAASTTSTESSAVISQSTANVAFSGTASTGEMPASRATGGGGSVSGTNNTVGFWLSVFSGGSILLAIVIWVVVKAARKNGADKNSDLIYKSLHDARQIYAKMMK